jgi:hypothetical protein
VVGCIKFSVELLPYGSFVPAGIVGGKRLNSVFVSREDRARVEERERRRGKV